MPLDELQRRIAATLKNCRSRQSFVGGSSVFNETFPRRSDDIDIYVEDRPIDEIVARDVDALRASGLDVAVNRQLYGFLIEAVVSDGSDKTKLEWNEADRRRFFPIEANETFGWALHKADLAVQKLIAAATRRVARDPVDVILIDRLYAPAAALALAAPAKLEGVSPTALLERVRLNAIGHPLEDYLALRVDLSQMPFELKEIKMMVIDMVERAIETILNRCILAEPGYIYLSQLSSTPVIPTDGVIDGLQKHAASERGVTPFFTPL